jgi:hypothetical protein
MYWEYVSDLADEWLKNDGTIRTRRTAAKTTTQIQRQFWFSPEVPGTGLPPEPEFRGN